MANQFGNLHGDAHWSNEKTDLAKIYEARQGVDFLPLSNAEPIGYETNGWGYSAKTDEGQVLCIAPNGTGKGASVIIPALLAYGGSVFCIDPKGENSWVTAERRRSMGQHVVILDPFGEVNRVYGEGQQVEITTRYNPLRELSPASADYPDDLRRLTEALIVMGHEGNPHWPNSARDLTSGLTSLVKEVFGDAATLRHVRRLMTGDPGVVVDLMKEAEKLNPDSFAVSKLRRFYSEEATDETRGVRSTAETQLAFLDSPGMLDHLDGETENPFSFSELLNEQTTVYVVLPPDRLETHARWLRLMLTLALKAITRAPRPPQIPHVFLCDEMGTIGPLETLEQGFALFRGYGIRFFGFLQTISQLKRDYPKSWQNFVGNCSYLQCLGARDHETAQYFEEKLGTRTVQTPDRTRQERRPLMLADEITANIGSDPRGPKFFRQILIRLDGNLKFLHFQNPYYLQPGWSMKYRQLPWRRGPWPQANMPVEATGGQNNVGGNDSRSHHDRVRASLIPPKKLIVATVVCFLLSYLCQMARGTLLYPLNGLFSMAMWICIGIMAIIVGRRYLATRS